MLPLSQWCPVLQFQVDKGKPSGVHKFVFSLADMWQVFALSMPKQLGTWQPFWEKSLQRLHELLKD